MKQIVLIVFLFICFLLKAQPPSKFMCRYGSNGYDVGYDLKKTLYGGYIIAGSTSSFGQGNTDFYLLKLDSLGQKKFETSFGGYSNEIAKSVIQLADSSFVLAGYTSSFGIGGYDIFLVKADKNGNLIWQKTFGGNDWDFAYNIELTSDGGFIICGTTYSFGYGNADGYIIKTDGAGNVTWTKTFGGKHDDEFKSVIQTSDGNYALTGYTKSFNDSLGDAWIFKIDLNGDEKLSEEIAKKIKIELDKTYGYDHGTWTLLKLLDTKITKPVFQISINTKLSLEEHFTFAKKLKILQEEGYLIIASGDVVHNLYTIDYDINSAYPWAIEFNENIKKLIQKKDISKLLDYHSLKDSRLANPELSHYIPLIYIMALLEDNTQIEFIYDKIQNGSISMLSFIAKENR